MDYMIVNNLLVENYLHKDDSRKIKDKASDYKVYKQSDFRNDVLTEDQFKKAAGRKWKSNLSQLKIFTDVFKYVTNRKKIMPIAIPTTGLLEELFGGHQSASNFLKLAQKVDLLKCVDDTYQFGAYFEDDNHSKMYILNKKVQDLIIQLCDDNFIESKIYVVNQSVSVINNIANIRPCLNIANIRVYSELNVKTDLTDEEIVNYLTKVKYPQIQYYQLLANSLNKRFYSNENYKFGIKFRFNINRKDDVIKSIGIRATNGICSCKEHENGKKSNKVWRREILDAYFGKNNWMEYDVKSSIYRVTYLLNHGVWLDNNVDLYEKMYGQPFDNEEQRKQFKTFAMRLYFDKSPARIWAHTVCKATDLKKMIKKNELISEIKNLQKNMTDTIGQTYDSEIFLHESCIYMELCKELLERGYKVVQVYDGFYVNRDCGLSESEFYSLCNSLLNTITQNYVSTYCLSNCQELSTI